MHYSRQPNYLNSRILLNYIRKDQVLPWVSLKRITGNEIRQRNKYCISVISESKSKPTDGCREYGWLSEEGGKADVRDGRRRSKLKGLEWGKAMNTKIIQYFK